MSGFRQLACGLAVALLLSACGGRDKVFLLPHDDGTPSGAVALLGSTGETHHVIDRHHTEVHVSGKTVHKSDAVDPSDIQKITVPCSTICPPRRKTTCCISGKAR